MCSSRGPFCMFLSRAVLYVPLASRFVCSSREPFSGNPHARPYQLGARGSRTVREFNAGIHFRASLGARASVQLREFDFEKHIANGGFPG